MCRWVCIDWNDFKNTSPSINFLHSGNIFLSDALRIWNTMTNVRPRRDRLGIVTLLFDVFNAIDINYKVNETSDSRWDGGLVAKQVLFRSTIMVYVLTYTENRVRITRPSGARRKIELWLAKSNILAFPVLNVRKFL